MISSTWTLAPAGAPRPTGSVVRPAAQLVGSPVPARLRALPGAPASGAPAMPVIGASGTTGHAQQFAPCTTPEHNGTTLGLHSSRRPSS